MSSGATLLVGTVDPLQCIAIFLQFFSLISVQFIASQPRHTLKQSRKKMFLCVEAFLGFSGMDQITSFWAGLMCANLLESLIVSEA